MPATFVDTSALYALAVPDDASYEQARATFRDLSGQALVTHNYVVLESTALMQARRGMPAVRRLMRDLLPVVEVGWITPDLHERALAALLAADSRDVSLVDRVSFAFMRERDLDTAFAFDSDFEREGFRLAAAR